MDKTRLDHVTDALAQMRARGGTWAVYENSELGHPQGGHLKFLKVGEGCTFATPPARLPDTPTEINWRYVYLGMIDLETGDIVDMRPPGVWSRHHRNAYGACGLIHELHHVLVMRKTGKPPSQHQEELTLAFEKQLVIAYRLLRPWHYRWMRGWGLPLDAVDFAMTWDGATVRERNKILERSRAWCQEKGLLDEQGQLCK